MTGPRPLTPRECVAELDRFIVGQAAAKRAVAVALRNRWRRQRVPADLRDEVAPRNIILMGPTGVGKTEIARRLARLAQAPFVKVEATKFTEVGYVGRDVDSMVRDLAEAAVKLVKEEHVEAGLARAREGAEERVLDRLLPTRPRGEGAPSAEDNTRTREKLRALLRTGALDDREVEVELQATPQAPPQVQVMGGAGMEEMLGGLQEMLAGTGLLGKGRVHREKMPVKKALEVLTRDEAARQLDMDAVKREALRRAEDHGIIFIDEIDKVAGKDRGQGPDVSRGGVQRDLLPVVEGSTITTKYGPLKTDHVLFIAAGAFHVSKVTDLIPELQGRFPIRVELEPLTEADLLRILVEPSHSLVRQATALLAAEGVDLRFDQDALREMARVAAEVNRRYENIGARRLHTVMEKLLEEVSFSAPERQGEAVTVTAAMVRERLGTLLANEDLTRFVL